MKHILLILFIIILPIQSQAQGDENQRTSEKSRVANGLYKDGLYSLVIKELERYSEEGMAANDECLVKLILGKSYFMLEDYVTAPPLLDTVTNSKCSIEEQEQAYYYLGKTYFKLDDMVSAKRYLTKLQHFFPESDYISAVKEKLAIITYLESIALFNAQKYDAALEGFKKVSDLGSAGVSRDEIKLKMADAYFYKKEYELAKKLYGKVKKVKELAEKKSHIHFQLAAIKYNLGKYKKAMEAMKAFRIDFPKDALSQRAESIILWSLFKLEKYEDALAYLNSLGNENQNSKNREVQTLMTSSSSLLASGDAVGAMELLESALRKFGKDPLKGDLLFLLAQAYNKAGYDSVEEETYKEIVKRYPHSAAARKSVFTLGEIDFKKGLYNKAADFFEEFLKEDTIGMHADDARFYLAESRFLIGELDRAQENFNQLIENYTVSSHLFKSHMRIADIEMLTGKYREAAKRYESIVNLYPEKEEDEDILWLMSEALRKAGDIEESVKAYAIYLDEYPEGRYSVSARTSLGDLYYLTGDYRRGVKIFKELVNSNKRSTFPTLQALKLARGFLKLNKSSKALPVLDLIIESDSNSSNKASAYFMKGWILQLGKKYKEANKSYAVLIKKFPDSQFREESLWQMANNRFALAHYKGALKDFNSFAKSYPDSDRNSEEMVRKCYAALGDFKNALLKSSSFYDMNPERAININKKYDEAMALFEVESFRDATKTALQIIEKFPTHPLSIKLLVLTGETYLKEERFAKAEESFLMANKRLKVGALKNLTYFRLGEIAYSEEAFRKSLVLMEQMELTIAHTDENYENVTPFIDPAYMMARTYFIKGDAYINLHLNDKSLAAFKGLIDEFPQHSKLESERLKAGLVFQQMKEYDLAVKALSQLTSLSSDEKIKAEAQYWLGESYQYKGDLERAIVEYLKVTYLYPQEGMWALTARYKAAQTYQEMGEYKEAISLYEKVARDSHDKRKREFARKRIEELTAKLAASDKSFR